MSKEMSVLLVNFIMHSLHSNLREKVNESNKIVEVRPLIFEAFRVLVHVFHKRVQKWTLNQHFQDQVRQSLPFFIRLLSPIIELVTTLELNEINLKFLNFISVECLQLTFNVSFVFFVVGLHRKRMILNAIWILSYGFNSFFESLSHKNVEFVT